MPDTDDQQRDELKARRRNSGSGSGSSGTRARKTTSEPNPDRVGIPEQPRSGEDPAADERARAAARWGQDVISRTDTFAARPARGFVIAENDGYEYTRAWGSHSVSRRIWQAGDQVRAEVYEAYQREAGTA